MTRRLLTLALSILVLSGCGTPSDKPDFLQTDPGPDEDTIGTTDLIEPDAHDDGPADDAERDVGPDETADADDVTADVSGDATADEGVPPPDGVADSGDVPDVDEPCSSCPGGICDPETLECLECTTDVHCGLTRYCDNGTCRDHLCSPDANFCYGSVLYKCSRNGGGFTLIQDCADNNPCTDGDRCETGRCVAGVEIDCADDNPCTIDYCGIGGVCDNYPAEGIVCDDGNPCTINDFCSAGECLPGGAMDCRDGNPCTFDYCVSLAGCIHEPIAGGCLDSNGCTTNDRCIEGRCSGTVLDCDDDNPCTSDYCSSGTCFHMMIQGCRPCVDDAGCEDGDPCTLDICETSSGVCRFEISRTGGCCAGIEDCPETPLCVRPICNDLHQCATGALDQAGCCDPDVLDESFDTGVPTGWVVENTSIDVGWRPGGMAVPVDGIAGTAMYFGNAGETDYDNGSAVAGSFTTPGITVPSASAAILSFNLWQDVDPTGGYDEIRVTAIVETQTGPTAFNVWERPDDFPLMETTSVSVDLSAFSGRTVKLEFSFDSIDEVENAGRGVYVDDIRVKATCKPLACLSDLHCTSAGFNGFCHESRCDFMTSWMEVDSFGSAGSGAGQFTSPTDVATMPGPEGVGHQILVSDSRTHYVQVFSDDGQFVRMFGGYGVNAGRFLTPRGLQDSEGRVFITDSSNGRIQAMTPAGVFLYKFGSSGIDPGQFDTPRDVAVSIDGNLIYVADTGNHRISVFSRLGVYQYSFGAWGRTAGLFRTPSALTVAPDGRVWVCDTQNNRVQVFSAKGVLSMVVAPEGDNAFHYPEGIAAMSDGRIVVADTYNHRLVILSADGRVQNTLGHFGTGTGSFNYPSDVDVMSAGSGESLVVADSGNFRVTVWAVRLW